MVDQYCILILLYPLFAALLVTLLGTWRDRLCLPVTLAGLGGSLIAAIQTLCQVMEQGEVRYFLGGWSTPLGIGIEYRVDAINGLILVLIPFIGLVTAVSSMGRIARETNGKEALFYALYLLLLTGLMGMTITADAFNLYVLLEVSSLTGYALVAMGTHRRAAPAAFNYLIMGTIGATFYLLGVGYLYLKTGSLNMADIKSILMERQLLGSQTVNVAFIMILVGVWVKMALFPLHGWLQNTYCFGPSATASVVAPLVTKVSIYIMIRMMLSVFGAEYVYALPWGDIVVWLAVAGILAGSVMALAQRDLKRMLTWLIVAEVGYMVGGAWLANHHGMVGAVYHIVSDAVMTSCLFLAAANILARTGSTRLEALENAFQRFPLTMAAFVVGAFSMIGIPPTAGFFSKYYLIRGGLETGHYEYVVALLISSLVNAVIFFRIIEKAFFGRLADDAGHDAHHEAPPKVSEEAPACMVAPLWLMAAVVVAIGWFNTDIVRLIESGLAQFSVVGGLR